MVVTSASPTTESDPRATPTRTVIALAIWVTIIAVAVVWGHHLPFRELFLRDVPPLFSGTRTQPQVLRVIPAAAVAVVIIAVLPRLTTTMRWRSLLLVSWLAAGGWAVSLAASDGFAHLALPLTPAYLRAIPDVGSNPRHFLQHFATQLPRYPTDVKGHGPLALLAFWSLTKIGLASPNYAAALVIGLGTSAVAAVAVTVRIVTDEGRARRVLPFLVLAPAALWIATSGDAMFLGVSAWGVAILAIATTCDRWSAVCLGAASGVLFGAVLYMTYGLLVLAPLPLAVLVLRSRWSLIPPVLVGVAAVAALFSLAGFSYVAGFEATRTAFDAGVGPLRSRPYFLEANVADLAIGVGPGAAIAIARLRDRRIIILVGAIVIALLASDVSGYVRGEAERIWLPFMPWLLVAAADSELPAWQRNGLLAAGAIMAVLLQALTFTNW